MTSAHTTTWLPTSLDLASDDTPRAFAPGWLSRHIASLDGLRGLAILMVTIFRFGGQFTGTESPLDEAVTRLAGQGSRGVDLFFVLSGFLITGILYDTKTAPRFFRDFYVRRSLRIFPLYYGVLLMLFLIASCYPKAVADSSFSKAIDHSPWLWLYGSNILQSLHNEWLLGPLNHFWSLAVEEHFYLVWPLVIYGLSRRQAMVACVAMAAVAVVTRVGFASQGMTVAAEVLTPCRMDALCMGAFLALYLRGPVDQATATRTIAVTTFLSGMVLIAMYTLSRRWLTIADTLLPMFCMGAIYCAVAGSERNSVRQLLESDLLRTLGKYSYGMYVYQAILIPLVPYAFTAEAIAGRTPSLLAAKILYIATMSCVSFVLAVVSYHYFEEPFLKLKDRLAPKHA